MELRKIQQKLEECLKNTSNDSLVQDYIGQFVMLLDEKNVTSETACLAIDGVDLDNGVNFLDTFAALNKKQSQDAWKIIKNCESYKQNRNFNSLKLMASFAASALGGDINTKSILGNILIALVESSKFEKEEDEALVYTTLVEYLFEPLQEGGVFPDWNTIKIGPERIINLCDLLEQAILYKKLQDMESMRTIVYQVRLWIQQGREYADGLRELQEREKNKPPKKAFELAKLADHFKLVEEELEKAIHENVQLAMEQKKMTDALSYSEREKKMLEKQVKQLEDTVNTLRLEVQNANRMVQERKILNDAQVQYREDSKISLLNDISRSLKAEYEDFAETQDVPMNETLGEIYREKLKQIFKILYQKGIKMEG